MAHAIRLKQDSIAKNVQTQASAHIAAAFHPAGIDDAFSEFILFSEILRKFSQGGACKKTCRYHSHKRNNSKCFCSLFY